MKWNFCEEYIKDPQPGCPADSYAYITDVDNAVCYDLRAGGDNSSTAGHEAADTYAVETRDDEGNINGLELRFNGGS